jgi:hypothetical protein
MTRDIVFFDRLSNNFFTDSIGINVRGVPSIEASIVCCLEKRK